MQFKLFICAIMLSGLFACSKNDQKMMSPFNTELAGSKKELLGVVNDILKMSGNGDHASSIVKVDYFGDATNLLAIITYDGDKARQTMGIQKQFDDKGELQTETGFTCNGTCPAKIRAVHFADRPKDDYAECSCVPSAMTVTVYSAGSDQSLKKQQEVGMQIQAMANRSHVETFNKFEQVRVVDIQDQEDDLLRMKTYTYQNMEGRSSTFIIVMPKKEMQLNGTTLKDGTTYEIDCTGTCDCKERYMPSTGSIVCSCSDCKMTIKEVIIKGFK